MKLSKQGEYALRSLINPGIGAGESPSLMQVIGLATGECTTLIKRSEKPRPFVSRDAIAAR